MRIFFAMQLFSKSVSNLIRRAFGDASIDLPLKNNRYDRLFEMIDHIDCLVDICNGRSTEKDKFTAYHTPELGRKMQEELLGILSWFAR